ncbi:sn1-specific diacylglycerol lipase alpha-like isoform X1, partial [Tachysurus ichikawai]
IEAQGRAQGNRGTGDAHRGIEAQGRAQGHAQGTLTGDEHRDMQRTLQPLELYEIEEGKSELWKFNSCGQEEPTYSALWGDNKAFDEVIISPAMLNEHMPHVVLDGLNKVLENPFFLSEQIATEDEESCAPTLVFVDQTPPDSSFTPLLSRDSSVFDFSPVPSADSLPDSHTPLEQKQEEEEEEEESSPLFSITVNPSDLTLTPPTSPPSSVSSSASAELISHFNESDQK